MKFSNKLSLAILITGMIVLIIVSYTIYKISYNSVIKSQLMYTKSIADEISDDIDQLLYEKVKTTLTLANTPIIKKALEKSNLSYADLSDEKRTKSIKLLNEKWKSTKDPADNFILKFTDNKVSHFLKNQQALLKGEYGEIFLTNKFGALVASTAKLSTFAHGHKYWWLGSYDNGEGAVFFDDRGYDDSVGGYVLGLVVPIRRGTEIIGILKCNLNILGSISELMSDENNQILGKLKLVRSGGMVVFEEGDILHTAVLPVGGDHLTNDIAIGLRTSLEVAEKVKREFGNAVPDDVDRKAQFSLADFGSTEDEMIKVRFVSEIIEARIEELFENIDDELRKVDRSGMLPVGVVLTGATMHLPGVADVSKRVLRLPSTIGKPIGVTSVIDEVQDSAYATAVGLTLWGFAIRGAHGGKFNLLNIKGVNQVADQLRKWMKSLIP